MAWPRDAYVGQKVVCVDYPQKYQASFPNLKHPQNGEIYTVREVFLFREHIFIRLHEIKNEKNESASFELNEAAWFTDWFRPLETRRTEKTVSEIIRRALDVNVAVPA